MEILLLLSIKIYRQQVQPINGQWIEGNKTLMEMIINSKKETIENMQGT